MTRSDFLIEQGRGGGGGELELRVIDVLEESLVSVHSVVLDNRSRNLLRERRRGGDLLDASASE